MNTTGSCLFKTMTLVLACLALPGVTGEQVNAADPMWDYYDGSYTYWANTQHPTVGYANNYYWNWSTSAAPGYPYHDYGWTNYYNYAYHGLGLYGTYIPLQPTVPNGGNQPAAVLSNHSYWPWAMSFDTNYWQQVFWNH